MMAELRVFGDTATLVVRKQEVNPLAVDARRAVALVQVPCCGTLRVVMSRMRLRDEHVRAKVYYRIYGDCGRLLKLLWRAGVRQVEVAELHPAVAQIHIDGGGDVLLSMPKHVAPESRHPTLTVKAYDREPVSVTLERVGEKEGEVYYRVVGPDAEYIRALWTLGYKKVEVEP